MQYENLPYCISVRVGTDLLLLRRRLQTSSTNSNRPLRSSGNAQKILTKNITSKDVTGEVVDIRSRLEARRQARLRYLELMKQAKNMEEVFQVQQEVDEIQQEMEAAAGRVEYLNHASVYSTIELTYFQVLDAFGEGFRWVGDLLVLLVTLWPLIPGVVALIWGVKRFARNNRAKATANTAAEPVKS